MAWQTPSSLIHALRTLPCLELALLGLATGFLAGLLGIGGGMIMVPFITAILSGRGVGSELAIKMAIATSMATIVFTSISSVRAHHRRGAVRWDLVKGLAPGIVFGAAIASLGIFAVLKGASLALFFAVFVSFSATQMFLDKKPAPSRQVPGAAGLAGAGTLIGLLSGLVGAGGGFISVPFMTLVQCGHTQRGGHISSTWLSDRVGKRGGLCDQWLQSDELACVFMGLHLASCAHCHCQLQRHDSAIGGNCGAQAAGQTAQAGVCQHFVRVSRLHALPRSQCIRIASQIFTLPAPGS